MQREEACWAARPQSHSETAGCTEPLGGSSGSLYHPPPPSPFSPDHLPPALGILCTFSDAPIVWFRHPSCSGHRVLRLPLEVAQPPLSSAHTGKYPLSPILSFYICPMLSLGWLGLTMTAAMPKALPCPWHRAWHTRCVQLVSSLSGISRYDKRV